MKFVFYDKEIEINDDLIKEYEAATRTTVTNITIESLLIAGDAKPDDSVQELKENVIEGMLGKIETIKKAPEIIENMNKMGI